MLKLLGLWIGLAGNSHLPCSSLLMIFSPFVGEFFCLLIVANYVIGDFEFWIGLNDRRETRS